MPKIWTGVKVAVSTTFFFWLSLLMLGKASGMLQGVYILRTVGSSDFKPNNGQEKLANLDEQVFGLQSTVLNTAAGGGDEFEIDGDSTMQSKLMRLSTLINLDSRLSVSCAAMSVDR